VGPRHPSLTPDQIEAVRDEAAREARSVSGVHDTAMLAMRAADGATRAADEALAAAREAEAQAKDAASRSATAWDTAREAHAAAVEAAKMAQEAKKPRHWAWDISVAIFLLSVAFAAGGALLMAQTGYQDHDDVVQLKTILPEVREGQKEIKRLIQHHIDGEHKREPAK
jgi:hypothetical protein